jgi:phage/plasmid-associated DNA primase
VSDEAIRELVRAAEAWRPDEDAGPRLLKIGSDIEIAAGVASDLCSSRGSVIFCEGEFWDYDRTHWQAVDWAELRRAVHRYDGVVFGDGGIIKLNKTRIDSILNEMGAKLARPNFFAEPPTGINCVSGFIAFAPDGIPNLKPHNPEHRCRHVLKGKWTGNDPMLGLEILFFSLLGQLLDGVFRGDGDAEDRRQLLAEIASAAALGYATRLRQPKAVILKGETAENGKSQILDLFRSLLPNDAIASIPAGKMSDERYVVDLPAKHLNAADELSGAEAIASDVFKAVITGEPVSGLAVYRLPVTFRPVAQHVFAINTLPSFSGGMDRGVQGRLLVVTFNRVIPREERVEHIGFPLRRTSASSGPGPGLRPLLGCRSVARCRTTCRCRRFELRV